MLLLCGYVILYKMEQFAEHSVPNSNYDTKAKKLAILRMVKLVFLGLFVMALMVVAFASLISEPLAALITFLIGIFTISPLLITALLIRRYIANATMEFDYFVIDGKFRIVKVIGRKKRKMFSEVSFSSFQSVGKLSSEAYDRYAGSKDVKKQIAVCNVDDEEKIYYGYYIKDGGKFLLHFEPSIEFMIAFKRSLPRMSIMDKSALSIK